MNVGFGDATERAEVELVSGNYFEVLGVRAALGRVFTMEDERAPGADPVIVLNHEDAADVPTFGPLGRESARGIRSRHTGQAAVGTRR